MFCPGYSWSAPYYDEGCPPTLLPPVGYYYRRHRKKGGALIFWSHTNSRCRSHYIQIISFYGQSIISSITTKFISYMQNFRKAAFWVRPNHTVKICSDYSYYRLQFRYDAVINGKKIFIIYYIINLHFDVMPKKSYL